MKNQKIIVIGGNVSGIAASIKAMNANHTNVIKVYEATSDVSYFTCAMPYYIGNQIDIEAIKIYNKEDIIAAAGGEYDILLNHKVLNVDDINKNILVKNLITNEEFVDNFDKLIICAGSLNKLLDCYKNNLSGVYYCKSLQEAMKIHEVLNDKSKVIKKATIIGAGFIGLELVEQMQKSFGIVSEVIEFSSNIIPCIDSYASEELKKYLEKTGTLIHVSQSTKEIIKNNDGTLTVKTEKNLSITSDIVIINIGIVPNNAFLAKTKLEFNSNGLLKTNEFLQTSNVDIYASGDVVENFHVYKDKKVPFSLALANTSIRQGHIVGENAGGGNVVKFRGFTGSAILHCLDKIIATTGFNENMLQMNDIKYEVIKQKFDNKPYKIGDCDEMFIELLWEKNTGVILGASAFGGITIPRCIDIIGTMIQYHGSIYDLKHGEFCYNPYFNFAKSPLNRLGYDAVRILEQKNKSKFGCPMHFKKLC